MNGTDNYEPFGKEWETEIMKLPKKIIIDLYVKAVVGIATGERIPETIAFETKDIVELLSFVDMSLQPDFPINKARGLLNKIKKICLKYGINWTGRVNCQVMCPSCKKMKPKEEIKKRRRGCNYPNDESNWLTSCLDCIEEDTKYWRDMNQEYINVVMGT